MSVATSIDFVVAGGAGLGLGHVMRSAALALAAARRGHRVRAFLDGDRAAVNAWLAASGAYRVLPWKAWEPAVAGALTCLDHPGDKTVWLDRLDRSRSVSIVMDDLRHLDRARLTICPQLHHLDESGASRSGERLLAGPRHALLGEHHRHVPRIPLLTRDRLLLSLGGADPHHATPSIAPVLERVLLRWGRVQGLLHWDAVLGPAFHDPGERVYGALVDAGWRVHRALEPAEMAERMAAARLAVMGFGTSLCELAWHGTPHLSVTHQASDDAQAAHLERLGIGRHLGCATRLDPDRIARIFRQALLDPAWQTTSAATAFDALEGGLGCERILDRLEVLAPDLHALPRPLPTRSPTP